MTGSNEGAHEFGAGGSGSPFNASHDAGGVDSGDNYPLKETAALLNDRLGLYLSAEQQKGFATGLLIGTAVAGALLAWNVTGMMRKGD